MNNYLVSTVLVKNLKNGQTNISNSISEVTAVSEDEAKGKAFTQVSKDFPEHQINTMLAVLINTNPWQQAIDDELVNAHLGIAQDGVTREEAKDQLNKLIAWHIDVAKYFNSQEQVNKKPKEGCRKKLAPDQWWQTCGETDMGQTLPALCTECGGDYKLFEEPN